MRRLLSSLIAAAITSLAASKPASALQLPWFDGVFRSIGTNIACVSDPPIFQTRVQAYTGYTLLPPNRTPAVGEVFYTHLIISHPGNPCGGSVIGLELLLPNGVTPAISAGNPAFCFARTGTYELELGGRKLVGSAQRRHGGSFLQHGSILLGIDAPRVAAIFPTTSDPAGRVATLEEASGRRPAWDDVVAALTHAFEAEHGIDLRPGALTPEELGAATTLAHDKYATEAWLAAPTVPRAGLA